MAKIKYCGNCNPEADPRKIRKVLEKMASDADDDILICVNGCSRMCLEKKMKPDLIQRRLNVSVREVFEYSKRGVDGGGER